MRGDVPRAGGERERLGLRWGGAREKFDWFENGEVEDLDAALEPFTDLLVRPCTS